MPQVPWIRFYPEALESREPQPSPAVYDFP